MEALRVFVIFLSCTAWILSMFSFAYTLKKYKSARTWFTFFTFRSAFAVVIAQSFNFFGLGLEMFPREAAASFYYLGTVGLFTYLLISIYRFHILSILQPTWMQEWIRLKRIGPITFVMLCVMCWPVWVVYGSPADRVFSAWFIEYALNGCLGFVFFVSFSDFVLQCLSLYFTMLLKTRLTAATSSVPVKILTPEQHKSFVICVTAICLSMALLAHVYIHCVTSFSQQVLPEGPDLCLLYASGCIHIDLNYFYMFEIAKLLKRDAVGGVINSSNNNKHENLKSASGNSAEKASHVEIQVVDAPIPPTPVHARSAQV
eukprot:TRINITY_DN30433_c0_g1_i1.p1 TRINITY_DN30433_c0_g1~~TRINITY_DN30433_c0_g1_i1.p1  ORF type:complete len:333 (+),score=60.04 TRINITY_DN30433_c0_g1_i1:54-1001(+)